jgi:hypothetical protein
MFGMVSLKPTSLTALSIKKLAAVAKVQKIAVPSIFMKGILINT